MQVPMDIGDYQTIVEMIGRVETKIDALRKEMVTNEVQTIVNADLNRRLTALENAPGKWLLYLGMIASLLLAFVSLLTHVKLLP